jgi:hypothetical protein
VQPGPERCGCPAGHARAFSAATQPDFSELAKAVVREMRDSGVGALVKETEKA